MTTIAASLRRAGDVLNCGVDSASGRGHAAK
jgi:hypothetical protein